jgi:hypothetical protein
VTLVLRYTRSLAAIALLIATLTLAACGGDDDDDEAGGNGEVTVELAEQNESGQSGTATLTPAGEQTTVTLELSNPPGDPQPVHIHSGTCEELGEVVYPLENLEEGASETTVDASLEELQNGEFAINAHESEENIANYIACGPIG